MLSKQTKPNTTPQRHPALVGATVLVGGMGGKQYTMVSLGQPHMVASQCGALVMYWPLWGNAATAQPQVLLYGKLLASQRYTYTLKTKVVCKRWGNL